VSLFVRVLDLHSLSSARTALLFSVSMQPWTPDSEAPCCPECGAAFTVLRRRHHCRQCGRVVCDECSGARVVLPQQQAAGRVRVCDSCVRAQNLAGEEAVASVSNFDSPVQSRNMSGSGNNGTVPVPVACFLPPAAVAQPAPAAAVLSPQSVVAPAVAAPVVASAAALAPAVAAPAAVKSPIPVAVVATAPRVVLPMAAAVPVAAAPAVRPAASSSSSSGGLFASLVDRAHSVAERHAPGLVSAIKEQVAAATQREEAERLEKQRQAERLIAAATGAPLTPTAADAQPVAPSAAPAAVAAPAAASSAYQVAHIPGLGPVALAASPVHSDESRAARDSVAWSNLPKSQSASAGAQPEDAEMQPESELRRRKGVPQPDESARGAAASVGAAAAVPVAPIVSSAVSSGAVGPSTAASLAAASSSNLKLDLPLRLCLVILKKTATEMRERYAQYLSTKAARGECEEPLSFPQFMFFSTIRTLPDFLFKKTELAFVMMREEGDTLVFEENFVRYAPILAPLASKLDARQLFYALQAASIKSGAALTEEQAALEEVESAEQQAEAAARGVAAAAGKADDSAAALAAAASASSAAGLVRRTRIKAGGVAFPQFKQYVDALKKYVKRGGEDSGWPEVFTTFPEVAAAGPQEQLLLVRTGVTDTTHFPPRIGRIGLTTSFLLYESSFFKRQNRAIRWSQITRIERSDESFWRKKAAQASSILPGTTSTSSSKGINIFVQEEEVVAGGSISLRASAAVGGSAARGGVGSASDGAAGSGPRKREECLTWDQPGWGEASVIERTRTFEYMRIMLALQRLVQSIPDKVVASALVQETSMSLLRMRALEAVEPMTDPLLLNPFSDDNIVATQRAIDGRLPPATALSPASTATTTIVPAGAGGLGASVASQSFVSAIARSISHAEAIKKSKSSWLFAVLPGLQDRAKEKLEDDIDPEFAAHSHYKTAEELAVLARAVEQPFSLKNFAYNVKLFRHQLEPVMQFFALVRRIRDWENPLLTLCTVLLLLNMAYRDLLSYLPALLVLAQIVVIATLRYYPNAVNYALGVADRNNTGSASAGKKDGDEAEHPHPAASGAVIEDITDENGEERDAHAAGSSSGRAAGSTPSKTVPVALAVSGSSAPKPAASAGDSESSSSSSSSGGLLSKLKNFRDVAVRTKEYLHSVQNQIGEYNVKMMKIEGLYKWRSPDVTQKFFLMLCGAFIVLAWVPFRFIFPVLVLDFFTTKWQSSSSFQRLVEEVALPQHMPDVD